MVRNLDQVLATYPVGLVNFKILIKLEAKRKGQFVQLPVTSSQLTVTRTTTTSYTAPVAANPAVPADRKLDVALYVDSVNGTRPSGTAPRPVGCTQTNVFKRSEQFVLRAWGSSWPRATSSASTENVSTATLTVPGVLAAHAQLGRAWGDHEPRLVLDGRLEHPRHLPARRLDAEDRVHARERQDRHLRLRHHDRSVTRARRTDMSASTPPGRALPREGSSSRS